MQQLLKFAMQKILDTAEDHLASSLDPDNLGLTYRPPSVFDDIAAEQHQMHLQKSSSSEVQPISPLELRQRIDDFMKSQAFRRLFRLPHTEKLAIEDTCMIFNYYERTNIHGRYYLSAHFLCFESKREGELRLILPLREVVIAEAAQDNEVLFNAIHVKTRNSNSFFFTTIPNRDAVLGKLAAFTLVARQEAGALTPSPSHGNLIDLGNNHTTTTTTTTTNNSASSAEPNKQQQHSITLETEPLYKTFGHVTSTSR